MPDPGFWRDRRVLLTGHTGFKGAWLALWLAQLGARVTGFSGPAPSTPSLYEEARVRDVLDGEVLGDVRDADAVAGAARGAEVVLHLAAQAIVRASLVDPVSTWAVNVVGTANVLQALDADTTRAVVVVTSDKCYRDIESGRPMREDDPLGGKDPYSASKAGQELVAAAHRQTILAERGIALATARAGNVIGGGDWAADRLVPDLMRAALAGQPLVLRNPDAVRPWQHVLNPLSGYLTLAERLVETGAGGGFDEAWNFGPATDDAQPVSWVVDRIRERWPGEPPAVEVRADPDAGKESALLRLDSSKAAQRLGWVPGWDLAQGLDATVEWYTSGEDARRRTTEQVDAFPAERPDALDARRLPRAARWRFAYLLVQGLSSTLLFVALAHALPAGPFSRVAVAQGVLVLSQAVGDFGLSQAATTALTVRLTEEPQLRAVLLAAAATTFWIGAVVATLLAAASSLLLPPGAIAVTALIAPAAGCTVLVAGADGLLRAEGEFRRPFALMAVSRLAGFAAVPVAIVTGGAPATALAITVATFAGTLPAGRLLAGWTSRKGRPEVRWFAAATLPLGLSQVLVVVSARLNTLILGTVSTVRAAAAFEAAWRLYQLGQYAGGVIASAGAPFVAHALSSPDRGRNLVRTLAATALALGILIGAGLYLLRFPLGDLVYPGTPGRVAHLLPILAAATPVALVGQVLLVVLSAQPRGRRFIPWAFMVGAIVNLAIVGAGVATRGAAAAADGAAIAAIAINALLALRAATLPPLARRARRARRAPG